MTKDVCFLKRPWVRAVCLLMLVGCGIKGPPLAPERPFLEKVATLAASVQGDTVILSWSVRGARKGLRGFVVFRATDRLSDPDCRECPRRFEKIGELTLDPDSKTLTFTDTIGPGSVHTYQVQPVDLAGSRGPGSNRVSVERAKADE
ncbi:MAG: hypothetical protein HKP58_18605 [Desulfatitalea sp.]|nr:hypothetical protein [Desulfatitalea sp.]NNK02429.1 hypothetical protein [Desulfatitalea sp.]